MSRCRIGATLLLLGAAAACSWTRFDDVSDNTPVVLLHQPDTISGFGSSLTALRDGPRLLLLAAGAPGTTAGTVLFNLGDGQSPGLDGFDIGCQKTGCFVAGAVAGVPISTLTNGPCFVSGVARGLPSGEGAFVRCHRPTEVPLESNLPVPAGIEQLSPDKDILYFVSDPEPKPAVLGGAPSAGRAWSYAASDLALTELVPPDAPPPSFGRSLAVLRNGGGRSFVVGAPQAGKLWLFDEAGAPLACIAGPALGRALAAGPVDAEPGDDLAVSGADVVHVLSGSMLAGLAPADVTTCFDVETLTVISRLQRRDTADVKGAGEFGAALAIGDIDADGDGEVAVGAPRATVRDNADGGAVFLYDVEGNFAQYPTETRFLASAEQGDQLGAALALAPRAGGALLVAGAPGGRKVAIFYCSKLLKPEQRGGRCD